MTIRKLISMVRDLQNPAVSDDVLLQFLSDCENTILTDVYLTSAEDCIVYTEITDAELLLPHPFDKLYLPYITAQLFFHAGEFKMYEYYWAQYRNFRDELAVYLESEVHPGNGRAMD